MKLKKRELKKKEEGGDQTNTGESSKPVLINQTRINSDSIKNLNSQIIYCRKTKIKK
jgi:hypothetical protein